MIELRAHHLLCVFGWRGHGYDEPFTENFDRVIQALKTAPRFKLVSGGDAICRHCPHDRETGCALAGETGFSPHEIDRRALDALDLRVGRVYETEAVFRMIKERMTAERLAEVCRGCSWLEFDWCRQGIAAAPPQPA